MTVEEFKKVKFERCRIYFKECLKRDVKFKTRQLKRLIDACDSTFDLGPKGLTIEKFTKIVSLKYGENPRINVDGTDLELHNPMIEAIFRSNPLLEMLPKFEMPSNPVTLPFRLR